MKPELVELTEKDILPAAKLITEAYVGDPGLNALLDTIAPATRLRLLNRLALVLVSLCVRHGYPLGVKTEGGLAAVGLYYLPGSYPVSRGPQLLLWLRHGWAFPLHLGIRRSLKLCRVLGRLESLHPRGRHVYSEITCVDARYRARGFAGLIRKHANDLADREQVAIYSETSNENNVRIWQRFGSRVARRTDILGVPYWLLWREPRRAKTIQ